MDITELILADHHEQRRMFAILDEMHGHDTHGIEAVWQRLRILLEVHAAVEERIFYPRLLDVGTGAGDKPSASAETKDAVHDHNQIRDAIAQSERHPVGTTAWWSAIASTRKANSDHMGEEEREALADFRQHASLALRHDLGVEFAVMEASHAEGIASRDKDPDRFVEHASAGVDQT